MRRNRTVLIESTTALLLCITVGWMLRHYGPIQQIGKELGIEMSVKNTCMLLNLISIDYENTPSYVVNVASAYDQAVKDTNSPYAQPLIWFYSRLGHIYVAAVAVMTVSLISLLLRWKIKK